jgi:hypothetical protein
LEQNKTPTQRKWHITITIANVAFVEFMLVFHETQPDGFLISLKLTLLLSLLMSLLKNILLLALAYGQRGSYFAGLQLLQELPNWDFLNADLFAHTGSAMPFTSSEPSTSSQSILTLLLEAFTHPDIDELYDPSDTIPTPKIVDCNQFDTLSRPFIVYDACPYINTSCPRIYP